MNTLVIIPARYASTRFPGKPLFVIGGKSMIRRVYEQASSCAELSAVVVATDHPGILNHVLDFGGKAVMTAGSHRTGTERCAEALEIFQRETPQEIDIVINIQGDEPFLNPEQISEVIRTFSDPAVRIATLARKISSPEDIKDPNVVKLVCDLHQRVLYFSRSKIPYIRTPSGEECAPEFPFLEHIGIYGFRSSILQELVNLPESSLEKAESLEQLRWLQHGYSIHVRETTYPSISIDTPADLLKITNRLG